MSKGYAIPAKYIFLDVVNFSKNRSVETQTEIIEILNDIVRKAIGNFEIHISDRIFLPTGDGICIALLRTDNPYDIHLIIASEIIKHLTEHNNQATDNMRRFKIRIGINSNIDNEVLDINGNKNIAGLGINNAQRIMALADGNQILVGQSVYEILKTREKYMSAFKHYKSMTKHGLEQIVYLFLINLIGNNKIICSSQRS